MGGVAKGAFSNWQNVTPFGIPDAHAHLLSPPPALTSNLYAKAYKEVKEVGSLNSTDRPVNWANVALYSSSHPLKYSIRQLARGLRSATIRFAKMLVHWP